MLGCHHDVDGYLLRLETEVRRVDHARVGRLAELVYQAWAAGQAVFVFGNGSSGGTASHLCEDLNKNALCDTDLHDEAKRRPRVMSLTTIRVGSPPSATTWALIRSLSSN